MNRSNKIKAFFREYAMFWDSDRKTIQVIIDLNADKAD